MMRVLVGLAIASIALVGGCRQSDDQVKAELRAQILERCTVTNAPRAADDAKFDARVFCTCVSDQMIGDRSLAEIRKLLENKEGAAEQGRQIGDGCFKQQMSSASAAADTPPVPSSPVPVAAPVASEAANEAAAGDEAEPAEASEEEAVEDSQ
jgi:hypothetical protein